MPLTKVSCTVILPEPTRDVELIVLIALIYPLSFVNEDIFVGTVGRSEVKAIVPVLSGKVIVLFPVGAPLIISL